MLNTLYFVRDAEYHDLKSSIIVYENDHTGIEHVGLNSSGLSRSFVGEFLDGALSVGENVFLVAKGDYRNSHVNELSNLCGLYLHGKHDQLIELQNEYSQFALDVKKVKIKSRAGKDVSRPVASSFITMISLEKSITFGQRINHLVEECNIDYVTIWPSYWGGYGKHFYIYASNQSGVAECIGKIKAISSNNDIAFSELDTIELLPVS